MHSIETVEAAVTAASGVDITEIGKRSRQREKAAARSVLLAFARAFCGLGAKQVARRYGLSAHSTVIFATQAVLSCLTGSDLKLRYRRVDSDAFMDRRRHVALGALMALGETEKSFIDAALRVATDYNEREARYSRPFEGIEFCRHYRRMFIQRAQKVGVRRAMERLEIDPEWHDRYCQRHPLWREYLSELFPAAFPPPQTQTLVDSVAAFVPPTLGEVRDIVSALTGVSVQDMTSPRRQRVHTNARKVFTHTAFDFVSATLEEVGHWLNKDHTTILTARREARKMLDRGDPDFTADIQCAREALRSQGYLPLEERRAKLLEVINA